MAALVSVYDNYQDHWFMIRVELEASYWGRQKFRDDVNLTEFCEQVADRMVEDIEVVLGALGGGCWDFSEPRGVDGIRQVDFYVSNYTRCLRAVARREMVGFEWEVVQSVDGNARLVVTGLTPQRALSERML